jgi:hypothetical protein
MEKKTLKIAKIPVFFFEESDNKNSGSCIFEQNFKISNAISSIKTEINFRDRGKNLEKS